MKLKKHTSMSIGAGHSMGGRAVQDFVRFKPERVLAFHIALRAHPTPKDLMTEAAPVEL